MTAEIALYLSAGIMLFGASIGAAIGIGLVGSKMMEGLGRQPTLLPMFRAQFFIMAGLIDAIPMVSLGLAMFIFFALGQQV